MRRDLPTGTVTFLFTDVEGSTRLLHELGPESYGEALAEHRRVLREACTRHGGAEVDTQGDAFSLAECSIPDGREFPQMAGSNVMRCVLREVRDEDLPLLFEQWTDPIAEHMAAFTTPDQADWDAFERRWSRLRADESVITRAIVVDGEVTGTIGSWGDPGEREVTYWIGRSHWGKGIATGALSAFLAVDLSRPLHARVAYDNVASRRVLEKCGFHFIATERGFAQARSAEIEEHVLLLEP